MTKLPWFLLAFALMSSVAAAQPAPRVSPTSTDDSLPRVVFLVPPELHRIEAALSADCAHEANAAARVIYAADGSVTDVQLARSSRIRDVDREIIAALRKTKISATQPGTVMVPFALVSEGPSSPNHAVRPCDVVSRPAPAGVLRTQPQAADAAGPLRLLIAWDARGIVLRARLDTETAGGAFEAALVDWARGLRMKPGRSGEGYLPIQAVWEGSVEDLEETDVVPLQTPEVRDIDLSGLTLRPPLMPLMREFLQSGLREYDASCLIMYDPEGSVVEVGFEHGPPREEIEHALYLWCRNAEVAARNEILVGFARLRFRMLAGQGQDGPDFVHVRFPAPTVTNPVIDRRELRNFWVDTESWLRPQELASSYRDDTDVVFRMKLERDAEGRVTQAAVLRGSGFGQVDEAAAKAIVGVRLNMPQSGSNRVVLDLYRHGTVAMVESE